LEVFLLDQLLYEDLLLVLLVVQVLQTLLELKLESLVLLPVELQLFMVVFVQV
jgi:hypothetical protein